LGNNLKSEAGVLDTGRHTVESCNHLTDRIRIGILIIEIGGGQNSCIRSEHLPIPSSLEDSFILELSVKFSKHGIETPCFTKTMVDMHNPVEHFAKTSNGVPNFVANVFALCIFACVFVLREEKRARGHKGKYQKFL
jgi:hypothetical protein